jgi:hypothetical protein
MKITTTFTLVCLASLASAQTKAPAPVKDPNAGGYFPAPGGSSFLVAGGSDDCSMAAVNDAITGFGTFAVTTTAATDGLPDAIGCVNTNLDVWFYWTATVSGPTIVNTCGGVTSDTVITVWDDGAPAGNCPTVSVGCNDDSCAFQSQVSFNATAGNKYFFQLGAFGAAVTYSGTFTVGAGPTPPTNDNCATPIAVVGAGLFPFDNSAATTGAEGQTDPLCLAFGTTSIFKDSWWTYTPTASGNVDINTCGQTMGTSTDTRIAVYQGAGCPTTPAIACNDDFCGLESQTSFTAVCGQAYTIQIGSFGAAASISGTFTIVESGTGCGPVATPYCFGDGTGAACPCANNGTAGNGCANSVVAAGGNLSSTGNPSIGADTFVLQGTGMPNSSALYFQGTSQIAVSFGDGLRCVGGTVIRLGTKANSGGASAYPVGADQTISVRGQNAAGNVREYQVWYRNAAAFCTSATFNLTNGLEATWTP